MSFSVLGEVSEEDDDENRRLLVPKILSKRSVN
jgi:hypothetical protein